MFEFLNSCKGDPSYNYFPLLGSPLPVWIITISYLLIVLKIGPILMRHRQPYNLRKVLIVYNSVQIIVNFYIFFQITYLQVFHRVYDITCIETMAADHPKKNYEIYLSYIFFLVRVFDYIETIFFVMRKSFKQVTFLHVFHHIVMVIGGYYYTKCYGTGGLAVLLGVFNSFVHGFMYSYYLLSALRSDIKKSIWWKRHITHLQLLQFTVYLIFGVRMFISDCTFPKAWCLVSMGLASSMIILFSDFYYRAYIKVKKTTKAAKD